MSKTIKLITYNIDGLPEQLDLNDLPWILKPIAWIYKLIKGTTVITINDNPNKKEDIEGISDYLASTNADIIAVQEDFNYHDNLMKSLGDNYNCGKYTGGFDLSKLFSNTEWLTHFPLPRFKCDGLNIIARKSRINLNTESITKWKKSYGYFTHANDLLTHKGFRFYSVEIDDTITLGVYVIHMDADFYDPEKCPDVSGDIKARESELQQLVAHIKNNNYNHPFIIMGDANSYDKYTWDVTNIKENLLDPINEIDGLNIQEVIPTNYNDCDKIYYINNEESDYKLTLQECYFDKDMKKMSDHMPLIATFNVQG